MSDVTSYLVRFKEVGAARQSWAQRMKRPIDEKAIVAAVRKRRCTLSDNIAAPYVHDYGGSIYAGMRVIGSYVIDPRSGK